MFEAVILMGGFGTRLKSISGGTPKPMINVAGEPFVYLLMKKLEKSGCKKIILSLHYQALSIKKKILSDNPVACELVFVVEDEPKGTGGALKLAAKMVEGSKFIALNGDTYSDIDYSDFYNQTLEIGCAMSGIRVEDAGRYGTLEYDISHKLISMTEKGVAGPAVINSGTYLIAKSSILAVAESTFSFEHQFIPLFSKDITVYLFDGRFIDIGIPEDYFSACEMLG